eukprot:9466647-Pyramimonas_sp.AAC.2
MVGMCGSASWHVRRMRGGGRTISIASSRKGARQVPVRLYMSPPNTYLERSTTHTHTHTHKRQPDHAPTWAQSDWVGLRVSLWADPDHEHAWAQDSYPKATPDGMHMKKIASHVDLDPAGAASSIIGAARLANEGCVQSQ